MQIKKIAIIISLVFLCFSGRGQSVYLIVPVSSGTCNTTIDVPVKVKDFQSLLSLQFSVGWDTAKLSFGSIIGFGPGALNLGISNFGLTNSQNGLLSFSWNDAAMSGITLPDSTAVFMMRFTVKGGNGSTGNISILNAPTLIEAIDASLNNVPVIVSNGWVNVSCSTQGSVVLNLIAPTMSGNCNSSVDIPIRVKNFQNLTSLQFTLGWDTSKLSYTSVIQFGPGAMNLSLTNFGVNNTYNGLITFSWNEAAMTGITLTDSTVIFTLRCYLKGTNGASGAISFLNAPTPIEVTDSALNPVSTLLTNGAVNVNCLASGFLNLIAPAVTGNCNNVVDVPVKVKNFQNLLSLQFTLGWDTSVIKYSGVVGFGAASLNLSTANFGLNNSSAGKLNFSWSDAGLAAKTLADSTILFTIRFTTSGTNGANGLINFLNSPTVIEAVDDHFTVLPVTTTSGSATIQCTAATTVYTFNGTGNWTVPSNWVNSQIPPAVLPANNEIIINPAGTTECVLNTVQRISVGAILTIMSGKHLTIQGNLNVQ